MTADTIFDLASMTKCVATATSVMKLVQEGRIRLNDPVAAYLPEFARNGKENITIRQLLTHFSGLPEDLDLKTPWKGRNAAYQMAMDEKPIFPPGSRFLYSDVNFETLGFVVEKVSGLSLDEYAAKNIFEPLAMNDTRFLPPAQWRARIAPTEYDESHHMMRGTVHDPTARRMGGVAGHAGLFSTADDLAKYAQDMLTGFHVLSALTRGEDVDAATAAHRGFAPRPRLGYRFPFRQQSRRVFSRRLFRPHRIYRNIDMDRSRDQHLRDRSHQRGASTGRQLRRGLAALRASHRPWRRRWSSRLPKNKSCALARITGYNEAMSSARLVTARNGSCRTGIDVLESHDFAELRENGAAKTRIAVVTNQTGVDAHGSRDIDVLAKAPGIEVVAIFSPEHGVTRKPRHHRDLRFQRRRHRHSRLQRLRRQQRKTPSLASGSELGGCHRLRHSRHWHALLHLRDHARVLSGGSSQRPARRSSSSTVPIRSTAPTSRAPSATRDAKALPTTDRFQSVTA